MNSGTLAGLATGSRVRAYPGESRSRRCTSSICFQVEVFSPAAGSSPTTAASPSGAFEGFQKVHAAVEKEYILKKLDETNGNVTRAAELLGLERSNLYRKMKTLGIGPKE